MSSYAIIGGGISGLSAAYYLSKGSLSRKIVLLESSDYLGGWVRSLRKEDRSIFEMGPRSVRGLGASGHNTLQLMEELNMAEEILPIRRGHPAASRRFIFANGKLNPMPSGLMSLLKPCAPFNKSFAQLLLSEPFKSRGSSSNESVDEFFRRRFGDEVAEYAADPLCRGVFAGDSRTLEMRSCFPAFYDLERVYGSLVLGALRKPKEKSTLSSGPLINKMKSEKWSMWTLRQGLGSLPESLVQYLKGKSNVELRTKSTCVDLQLRHKEKSKLIVSTQDGRSEELEADHIICALPSSGAGAIFKSSHPDLSALLNSVGSVSVAVSTVQYKEKMIPIQGFGHLIPSTVIPGVLGVIYESAVFPQHDGNTGGSRYTVMMGGAWFNDICQNKSCDPDTVSRLAVKVVHDHLGITLRPRRVVTNILQNCIPQYLCSHGSTVERIGEYISQHSLPVSLVGASYKGVSVNDCIFNSKLEVEKILHQKH